MIKKFSVTEIYALTGFPEMVKEYEEMADPDLPAPTYMKEEYLLRERADAIGVYGAIRDGKIVGFVSCIKGRLPKFGIDIIITESIFVMKAFRKYGYGNRLIEAVEDYGRVNNVPQIFINIPYSALETIGVVLNRKGYVPKTVALNKKLWN